MKKPNIFAIPLFIFFIFILITTTHQHISSSPGFGAENEESPLIKTEKELAEMQEVIEDYENWLTSEIETSGTVGAAVAIVYKNQVAFTKCFGTRKAGSDEPVDEQTIFRLASVSKPITGVLSGILAQEKIIDYDEYVKDCLPGFRLKSKENTDHLTIRNLLSHTSGLVPHAYDNLVEGHVPLRKIYDRLKLVTVSAAPGKFYGYQNVMFSLVDTVLAVKTSKNYGELVKEKLFEPLGMNNASTDFESFRSNPNKAYPHREVNGDFRTLPLNNRYYTTAPAAGVNASISDMTRFLQALLDENKPLLDEEIQQTIFQPQVVTPLSRGYFKYWENVDKKNYGLGWRIINYKDRKVAYHGGYVNGYKAEIALCQKNNIGIVYLTNSPNTLAAQSIPVFLNSFFEYLDKKKIVAGTHDEEEEHLKIQGS